VNTEIDMKYLYAACEYSANKSAASEPCERVVHCQEFYRSLHPQQRAAGAHYEYDRFTADARAGPPAAHALLSWYYVQNCLDNGCSLQLEADGQSYLIYFKQK
jgi:hypothetical protein